MSTQESPGEQCFEYIYCTFVEKVDVKWVHSIYP